MSFLKSRQFWLGTGVSLLCLWLALRNVPLPKLIDLVTAANPFWLIAALLLQLLAVVARAQRWVVLLRLRSGLSDSFWAQSIGYLFTNIFPLRLGEAVRVLVMSQRRRLPLVQVGASAIVERLLDVALILIVLLLVLPWMQVPQFVLQAGLLFGIVTLTGLSVLVLAVRFEKLSRRLLRIVGQKLPFLAADSLTARWSEMVKGLAPLAHWPELLYVAGWSVATWTASILVYWCVIRSFQPDGALIEAAFMIVALALAVAVPSSPGFIGVFQFIGQQALVLPFGHKYSVATALAITLMVHLIYYLVTTVLGAVGLWRFGQSLRQLSRLIRRRPFAESEPALSSGG